MRKNWNFREIDKHQQKNLTAGIGISSVAAGLLLNRGISNLSDARKFISCSLKDCLDPFLLKGMPNAVSRIHKAIREKEKIVVYGDYDVDGLTSCALLYRVFSLLGAHISCYIPHRLEEGYGLNLEACKHIKERKASLVITVDCGISSFGEIKELASLGIEAIITDHHHPLDKNVPDAYCVIDPLQEGCSYPYKELAGVGLAYKLAEAVSRDCLDIKEYLDFVALGTISDVAPLTGENRILVKHGLNALSRTKKPGLLALLDVAGISKKTITSQHVGYILGPRINASGRMGSAHKALDLLLSENFEESYKLAEFLNQENKKRQKLEENILKQALAKVESQVNFKEHRAVVLEDASWHPGVIGIVASRIAERFYRPTVLFSSKGELARGSGRSIPKFHLFEALLKCEYLLEEFGGHENAAGLSIRREKIDDFRKVFNEIALQEITPECLVPGLEVDMEIPLSGLSEQLLNEVENFAPFGAGNPQPIFASRMLKLKSRPKPMGKNGFKIWLTDEKVTCEAIGNVPLNYDISDLSDGLDIAYSPSLNNWQGISTIQLRLKDMKIV